MDQVLGARRAVSSVRRLVEQLRDVAVVSLDRSLEPAGRATLQRQVDRTLADIDDLAGGVSGDAGTSHERSSGAPGVIPSMTTATLGIGLGVRSSDDAFGTMRALDRVLTRLAATALSLDGAAARVKDQLDGLLRPGTTAGSEPALTGEGAALTSSTLTGDRLRTEAGGRGCRAGVAVVRSGPLAAGAAASADRLARFTSDR